MPNLIRIQPGQKKNVRVSPPFPLPAQVTKDELAHLVIRKLDGSVDARDRLIMGNVYLVLNMVGRFLHYWPQTKRFQEDMVSEGLTALIEVVDGIALIDEYEWLVYRMIVRIRDRIEVFVNENQSLVSASFRTNRRRDAADSPLELSTEVSIRQSHSTATDEGPAFIDIADALDVLMESDTEEIIDAVIMVLENKHHIKHADLTPEQFNMMYELIKISKGE